jgi:hypothetical protein
MEAHDIAYDSVANVAMIGTQDNGTQIQSETGSQVWVQILGGDGGDVAIDDTSLPNYSIRYGSAEFLFGFFRATYNAANLPVTTNFPALALVNGAPPLEPNFVSAVKLNKVDPTRLVIGGGNSVYESLDQGDTISAVLGVAPGFDVALAYGGFLANLPYPDVLYSGSGSTVFLRTTNDSSAYTVTVGTVLSVSSQAAADQRAHQIACDNAAALCQPAGSLYYNTAQTSLCIEQSRSYTVPAGVFVRLSQTEADHQAFLLAVENVGAICSGQPLFLNAAQTCVFDCGVRTLTRTAADFPGATVRGIVLDSKDWHRAFVIDSSSVYMTPDAGRSWTNITGNLTGVGRLHCLEYVNFPCSDVIAVGTDTGVYRCLDEDLGEWAKLGAGLPNAPAYDLSFNPRAHKLVVGTLGRGAWLFDVPTHSQKISALDRLSFADTAFGSSSQAILTLCSSCSDPLVVSNVISSDPQFVVIPPASGFPVTIAPDDCLSITVQFAPLTPGDLTTIFTVTSDDPLSPTTTVIQGFGHSPGTHVAIYGAEQDFNNGDVKAKIVGSGLFSAPQVDVFSVADGAPIPTLTQLQKYDAVLIYSNDRFTDPTAMGNVLADYVDSGGGVVIATHSYSSDGFSGLEGRLVTSGYLPFGSGLPQFNLNFEPPLTLMKVLTNHFLLQHVSAFDGGLASTRDAVTLSGSATLVGQWSDGTPLLATASNRVVGLNFWPPSDDSDPFGWDSSTDGGRIMANALLWAGGQANNDTSGQCSGMVIINFDDFIAPADFPETTHLTSRYQAQGVTFTGPGGSDGGAVLNESSLFSVTGYSGRNVLAFNTAGRTSSGGIPRGPESISFALPMVSVRLLAGSGLNPGFSVTLMAYDSASNLLASSSTVLSGLMAPLQVTAAGIQSVRISTASPTLVLDDLTFVPACAQPQIMTATARRLPGGQYGFAVSGRMGAQYDIEVSTDMRNWSQLTTMTMTNTTTEFMDTNTNSVRRFYRASMKVVP